MAVIAMAICAISYFFIPFVPAARLYTATVNRGVIETSVAGNGVVAPAFEMIINSPVSSRIDEVYCQSGDTVGEGTPLLRLDLDRVETEIKTLDDERAKLALQSRQTSLNNHTYLSDLEMQSKVKEMEVNRLKQEVASERRLDSIGSGTGERVRQAEFAYETARLQLDQLCKQLDNERNSRAGDEKMRQLEMAIFDKNYTQKRQTLEDAKLRSPRRATLTYINNQIGAQVSQGERVAVIADLSHFKVRAEISDGLADRVVPGGTVIVKLGTTKINGHISNVAPLSKNGVISFDVSLDDDVNPRLRPGLRVDTYVMCDLKDDAVIIPVGPYYRGKGSYTIFVKDGDTLLARKVELGDANYEKVEVLSGLQPGETVVISDMTDYSNKSKLKIK